MPPVRRAHLPAPRSPREQRTLRRAAPLLAPVLRRGARLVLSLGYQDVNDHDTLRTDSLLALAVKRPDVTGESRARERDRGHPLAGEHRYKRIVADADQMDTLLADLFAEQHLDLFADRTSTATVRSLALAGTELARAQFGTIRTQLLKVAAQVQVSVRRIRVSLSSLFPRQALFAHCMSRLRAAQAARIARAACAGHPH